MLKRYLLLTSLAFIFFGCSENENYEAEKSGSKGLNDTTEFQNPAEAYPEIFDAIQRNRTFKDSKTFADAIPKKNREVILKAFTKLTDKTNQTDLFKFADKYFDLPIVEGKDFETQATRINDHIESLWPILTKKSEQSGGSLIKLPNPYVVPGGRFQELYYWGSYFTMLGLQTSGQFKTIEGMVDNFAYLINTFGFIPNGSRTYYLSRSQPPFFSAMVKLLAEEKGDEVYSKYLEQMRTEYFFWMDGISKEMFPKNGYRRIVRMYDNTLLNRYFDDVIEPRAEAYAEDIELKESSGRDESIFTEIRAACESGWDFSSRWCEREIDIKTIRTTKIIPVDLNSILYDMELNIAYAYKISGDTANQRLFEKNAEYRRNQIWEKCWDNSAGYFMDYDWVKNQKTGRPTLAGMYPLYFGVASQQQANRAAEFIERFFLKPGGVITSMLNTGHQWDAPNGWAPLHWITVQGLRNYNLDELATKIEDRWLRVVSNYYNRHGKLVEKYDVMNASIGAAGGTYPNQDGFGWTNGVYLKMASKE